MTKGTRVLCSIFGFYLSLMLLVPQLAAALYWHFFDPNALYDRLCSPEAASQALEKIVYDGEAVADGCGVPHSIFDGVFSEEKVRLDMTDALRAALAGESFVPELSGETALLEANVRAALTELDGVTDFTEYEGDIAAFCEQIRALYLQYVDLSVYGQFPAIYAATMRILKPIAWAAAATGALCLLFLLLLTGRSKQFGRELSFSILASGGLLALLSGALLLSGVFAKLQIEPIYLRNALRSYLNDGLRFCLLTGLITLLLGGCVFALSAALAVRRARRQT